MNGAAWINSIPQPQVTAEPEDYTQDGLLYCGRCGTPRQIVLEVMGRRTAKYCLCRCRAEARDREAAAFRARQELERFRRMRTVALADRTYRQWTFGADDGREPKMNLIRRYADHWEEVFHKNIGLLLWGDVGTGKSFAAACIVNALTERGVPCLMTSFIRVEHELFRCGNKNAFIADLNRYNLLVIDDLGAERNNEYMQEIVFEIIDARYRAHRPLIVTTNLTLEMIKDPEDTTHCRIFDRVLEMTVPVQFTVLRRADAHRQKMQEAAGIFIPGEDAT